jgi:hypothetical protein
MALIEFETLATATNSGSISSATAAAKILATWYPPFDCYVIGAWAEVTTDVVKGSTTAGALGVYYNAEELGALTLTNDQDAGECYNVPFTRHGGHFVDFSAGDVVYLLIKTLPVGGSFAGVFRLHLIVQYDPRDTTCPEITGYTAR